MSTWILLRGLTRGSGHWAGFPDALKARLGDTRLVTLDLPGNGALHRLRSPARIEAMTQESVARLHALGIEPPWHLLAVSMGAMVAVDWAARAPHTLAGCVLINTSLRPFSPFYRRLKPGNYPRLLGLALSRGSDLDWESAILELTSRQAGDDELLASWLAYRRDNPVSLANALRQLIAAARYRAPRVRPPVPLLILSSRHDALVDSRCSAQLARCWNAPHAEHPSAGHDLPLDDGAWVAQEISHWLTSLDQPSSASVGGERSEAAAPPLGFDQQLV